MLIGTLTTSEKQGHKHMKINVLIVVYTKRDDVCLTNACLALIVPIGLQLRGGTQLACL